MKNALLAFTASLLAVCAGSAGAQSCASPATIPLVANMHQVSGTTCAPSVNQLGTLCGAFNSPENDVIYRVNKDSLTATTITLSTPDAGWNPAFLWLAGSCGGGVACAEVGDNAGAGGTETMTIPGPLGVYYLVITSSPGSGGCGAYTVDAPRIPVTLKSFNID